MTRRPFDIYQYLAPLILTPLSFWLWWRTYDQQLWLTLTAWLLPIIYAYVVPAIGTNVLKVWEFDTRLRLGRFRPHHGFVFGSATATIAWIFHFGFAQGVADLVLSSLICALVLGVINTLYDIKALAAGVLHVYNQPWAEGKGASAIALDYAPWFFGGFGAAYGVVVASAEWYSTAAVYDSTAFIYLFPLSLLFVIAVPVLGYCAHSYLRHGHFGTHPIQPCVDNSHAHQ